MIQSKIVKELMNIYKQAASRYEYNLNGSFYKCLENQLVYASSKYNNGKDVLENYRIACQSYLDSNFLEFKISVCALLISIASLVVTAMKINVGIIIAILIIIITFSIIKSHIKRRKLLEIYYVFEKMKDWLIFPKFTIFMI